MTAPPTSSLCRVQDLDALKYWAPQVTAKLKQIQILVDVNSDQQTANAGIHNDRSGYRGPSLA